MIKAQACGCVLRLLAQQANRASLPQAAWLALSISLDVEQLCHHDDAQRTAQAAAQDEHTVQGQVGGVGKDGRGHQGGCPT
jgi:hypothetical protein